MKIKFKQWDCVLAFHKYVNNDRLAILLLDDVDAEEFQEQVATATVNLPYVDIGQDFVAIKNYSENEGMLECLMEHNVVKEPLYFVEQGHVEIPICELTDITLDIVNKQFNVNE